MFSRQQYDCKIIFRDKARKSSLEGREVKTSRVGNAIRSRQDTFLPRAATPLAETRGDLEGLGFSVAGHKSYIPFYLSNRKFIIIGSRITEDMRRVTSRATLLSA